jgi:hypothetical protein
MAWLEREREDEGRAAGMIRGKAGRCSGEGRQRVDGAVATGHIQPEDCAVRARGPSGACVVVGA